MPRSSEENNFLASYDAYSDAIFRFCYFKTREYELARDLTQDTFMKAWDYISKDKVVANMRAFLYRIATNLVIDWYRKGKTESLEDLAETGFDPADPCINQADQAEISWAMKLLHKLPEEEQTLITLRYVEGLSPREIAEQIGDIKENVVSVRIHRAMKKLKTLISEGTNNTQYSP